MYTLVFKSNMPGFSGRLEIENLEDILENTPIYQEVEEYPLKSLFDNIDYSIDILKPIDEINDYLFIYNSNSLWNMGKQQNFNLVGHLLEKSFPKFKDLNLFLILKYVYKENLRVDGVFKIYENNYLLSVKELFFIKQGDYVYICTKDVTDYYLEHEKREKIFQESKFPSLYIDNNGNITRINQVLIDSLGYSIDELNDIGLDNLITNFYNFTPKINSIRDAVNNIFNQKMHANDAEIQITTKEGELKWFTIHIRPINREIILITFLDVTDLKESKEELSDLNNHLEDIQEMSKTAYSYADKEGFHWTDEICTILEIPHENYSSEKQSNILFKYCIPEDKKIISNNVAALNEENPIRSFEYKVKTAKGNIKILKTVIKLKPANRREYARIGFTRDITEETLAKQSAFELQRNLDVIQDISKIVIGTFEDGKYSWTSEIYHILEISPEDYPGDIDLIEEFVIPEEKGLITERLNELTPESYTLHKVRNIITPNGERKILEGNVRATKFNENGDLESFVTFINDATERYNREEKLIELSKDRKILLQEVHHRVKNNLQLIISLLNLDLRYNYENPLSIAEDTRDRIQTMALTHEEVYNSSDISSVNLKSFLTEGMNNLFNNYTNGHINTHLDIEDVEVEMKKSIPLGLLVNEVALNTIKYAFPNKDKGNFYLTLKVKDEDIILKAYDDGIGLPEDVDFYHDKSLGFLIINSLTNQLEAELTLLDVKGFGIELKFKK